MMYNLDLTDMRNSTEPSFTD